MMVWMIFHVYNSRWLGLVLMLKANLILTPLMLLSLRKISTKYWRLLGYSKRAISLLILISFGLLLIISLSCLLLLESFIIGIFGFLLSGQVLLWALVVLLLLEFHICLVFLPSMIVLPKIISQKIIKNS